MAHHSHKRMHPRPAPRDPKQRVNPPDVVGCPLHAHMFLAEAMGSGVGKAIERSEAEGQRALVHSAQLPKNLGAQTAGFEKIGIVFITRPEAAAPGDLFVDVVLPTGWKVVPTEHSMWSTLVDGKGRERASIFYKAAFYDRSAHAHLLGRFSFERYAPRKSPNERTDDRHIYRAVCDRNQKGAIVFMVEERLAMDPKADGFWRARDVVENKLDVLVTEWLTARYPQWEDPTAHWEEP